MARRFRVTAEILLRCNQCHHHTAVSAGVKHTFSQLRLVDGRAGMCAGPRLADRDRASNGGAPGANAGELPASNQPPARLDGHFGGQQLFVRSHAFLGAMGHRSHRRRLRFLRYFSQLAHVVEGFCNDC